MIRCNLSGRGRPIFTKSGELEILLVTTRQSKRWMIPKGWPIKGLKAVKSAAREAYEEAGVRGAMQAKPIGIFLSNKRLEEDGITVPCEVKVFPRLVKRQDKTWPESHQRQSRWFTPTAALSEIEEKGLRVLRPLFVKRLNKNAG
jgi:ADP-ribose pyrophosphatase YjhB (NUDIX family)